jgi:16S rRNA (guanine(966)-N(2))-methyltransferase RsmD
MRIIAGQARGRRLATPPKSKNLRPTTDRVREAIFGVLASRWDLRGVDVLDLFAGTGALGCEALSRGANSAVFVDHSHASIRTVKENLRRIGRRGQEIIQSKSGPAIRAFEGKTFDIVFLDPPYNEHLVTATVETLEICRVLAPGATIIAEHSLDEPLPKEAALRELKHVTTRTYGTSCISMWDMA